MSTGGGSTIDVARELRDVRTPVATVYGGDFERFDALWTTQLAALQSKFGAAIVEMRRAPAWPTDVPIIYVAPERVVEVLQFAKSDPAFQYEFLSDLTATDESPEEFRFEVVYQLLSFQSGSRLRFKVRLREGQEVPTVISVWPGANWAEREVWDMFGVRFSGHPDLRRILMDERWVGHPLRKDYPLRGYQVFTTAEPVNPSLLED